MATNDMAEIGDALRVSGMINPGGNNQSRESNPLQQLIMMQMLSKQSPQFLTGSALGQLLALLFSRWKNNYDAKSNLKNDYQTKSPEEFEKRLEDLKQYNPNFYKKATEKYLPRWGYTAPSAETTETATPQATTTPVPQSRQPAGLPSIDFNPAMNQTAAPYSFQNQGLLSGADNNSRLAELMRLYQERNGTLPTNFFA